MAITYGMSVKQFWEDNPDLFWIYRFSYFEQLKSNQEIFNYNAWLQGAYIHEAVSVALNNGFSKQKVEYSKQPYGVKEQSIEIDNKKQIEMQVIDIKARISQINAIRSSTISKENNKESEKVGDEANG